MTYERIVSLDIEVDASMQSKTYLNRKLREKADAFADVFMEQELFNEQYRDILDEMRIRIEPEDPFFGFVKELDADKVISLLSALVDSHRHGGWTLMNSIRNGRIHDLLRRLETIDCEERELPMWIERASKKALNALRDFPQGAETTPYLAIKPFLQYEGNDGRNHERALSSSDEFDIVTALKRHAPEFGLYLDSFANELDIATALNHHVAELGLYIDSLAIAVMEIELPVNIPFSVRKVPVGTSGSVSAFTFSCGACLRGHSVLTIREFLDCTVATYLPGGRDSEVHSFAVSNEQLEGLRTVLDEVGATRWGVYRAPVLDGIGWHLVIEEQSQKHESDGSNAFPSGFDKLVGYLSATFGCKEMEIDGGYERLYPEYSNPVPDDD